MAFLLALPPFLPRYFWFASSATDGFARMLDLILPLLKSRSSFPVSEVGAESVDDDEERERPGSENATTSATVIEGESSVSLV